MQGHLEAAWERMMKIQEVILRAMAKRITWWQAAEIASCELDLANFRSAEESVRLSRRLEELRHALDEMVREWREIEMSLDESAGQS